MATPQQKRKLMGDINVVPMIDVMLVLLVVFMVTAPLLTQGIEVDLPEANAKPIESVPDKEPLVVSVDAEGNVYNTNSDGSRRWVIYNGDMEARRVSPEWHGWLHHTFKQPPTEKPLLRQPWESRHSRNLTGSGEAYVPAGSLRSAAPAAPRDYVAWEPAAADDHEKS